MCLANQHTIKSLVVPIERFRPYSEVGANLWCFSTVWYDSARLSTARHAFPLQFSTALEWAGLFISHYSCATSTAMTPEKLFSFRVAPSSRWIRSSAINERNVCTSSIDDETAKFWLLENGAFVQNTFYPSLAVLI